MDLLEYQGKQLFARHGVPVPNGTPATTVEEAVSAADEIGYPCVVKAQVQVGGRGKAGGIKLAKNRQEAEEHATAILGMDIKGHTVHEVWVEAASDIVSEYYASIVFDRSAKRPLVLLSTQGGMDIEEVADTNPDAIARLHVDPLLGFQDFHGRRLAFEAGVDADVVRPIGALLTKLYDAFVAEEAMLVEVNPLIVTPDREVKALDAKVTLDDNSLFRHPDNAALRNVAAEDEQERMARERGLTFVKLDGNVGILGNGAGLVMSTLDVVAQAGGKPANFLDAGGGSRAEAITQAVEVILSNENVTAVLFNIFGGITRCDEVAKGLIEAFAQINPTVPVRRPPGRHQRRRGPQAARRREPAQRAHRVHHARRCQEGCGAGRMSILVDNDTKLVTLRHHRPRGHLPHAQQPQLRHERGRGRHAWQGRPGRRGRSRSSTRSTTPSGETGANTAMIFVPPRFAADSILEAEDAGISLVICITEGIPAHDELRVYNHLAQNPNVRLVGPNCPGILSPGKANVGIIPAAFFREGNVGVVSRSGTLTYQIGNELAQSGFGNSSIVGIGGDPVPGSSFVDIIASLRGRTRRRS